MEKQVNKEHYRFENYCSYHRFTSYWHQLNEVISIKPQSLLEIGIGDGVFSSYIKNNTNITYKSCDIDPDMKPDILSSIDDISVTDESFDIVCAFQVLEHLPYEKFVYSLNEMSRISKKYIILSLPFYGKLVTFGLKIPGIKKISLQYRVPHNLLSIKHIFNGQHHWEIGKKGYSIQKIKKDIKSADLKIIKSYSSPDYPYHHFFVLKKNSL